MALSKSTRAFLKDGRTIPDRKDLDFMIAVYASRIRLKRLNDRINQSLIQSPDKNEEE